MNKKVLVTLIMIVNSILFTTAIINVAGKSLPLFYCNFLLAFTFYSDFDSVKISKNVLKRFIYLITAIFIIGIPRIILNSSVFISFDLPQILAYSLLITNGFLIYVLCKSLSVNQFNDLLKKILFFFISLFIYGIYTHFAQVYGLPRFFDFLINSASFSFSASTGGWVEIPRAYAVWSEPSYSILPLAITIISIFKLKLRRLLRLFFVVIILYYTYLTYSRIAYIGVISVTILYYTAPLFRVFRFRLFFSLIFMLLFTGVVLVSSTFSEDGSTLSRAESILIGTKLFLTQPITGTGYNTYGLYNEQLSELPFLETEKVVHNLPVAWLQQGGALGFLFLYLVFIAAIEKNSYRLKSIHDIYVFSALIIGCLSGNILYFSIFWAFYFIFLAQDEIY
ncbi:hypothetical protein EON78_00980, partial [bacterium]